MSRRPTHWQDGDHYAEIVKGRSIRIWGTHRTTKGNVGFQKTFVIGSRCVRSSFNLVYVGVITAIGPKTVTVKDADLGTVSRLSIGLFASRNWNYDPEAVAARNSAWMD